MKREESGNQDFLKVLPEWTEFFVCTDPDREDIYGQYITDVHIRLKRAGRVMYYCYGSVHGQPICFDACVTLEAACSVIASLVPVKVEGTVAYD